MSSNLHFVAKCTFSQKKCTILFSLCKFVFCWPFVDAKITQNPKIWIRAQKLTEWHRYVRKLNQDRNPFNMFFFVLFWRISVSGRVAGWGQGGPQSSFCKTQSLMFHQQFQILNILFGSDFCVSCLTQPEVWEVLFSWLPTKTDMHKHSASDAPDDLHLFRLDASGSEVSDLDYIWFFWFWGSKLDTCQSDGYLPQASRRFQKSWEMILILECESGP